MDSLTNTRGWLGSSGLSNCCTCHTVTLPYLESSRAPILRDFSARYFSPPTAKNVQVSLERSKALSKISPLLLVDVLSIMPNMSSAGVVVTKSLLVLI